MNEERRLGIVKHFRMDGRNYGFIAPRSGGRDIFFHISKWCETEAPSEGDHVSYVVALDQRSGKSNAVEVRRERD